MKLTFSTIISGLQIAALISTALLAAQSVAGEDVPESYREAIRSLRPMDTGGLDPDLASVLHKYYDRTFGGRYNWENVQSVRFDGLLHLAQGTVRFVAFKKKPDYCKVVLFVGGGRRIVMAYDGEEAWQLDTSSAGARPIEMPPKEAKNFIRDATIAGHLIYPALAGKQIRMLGIVDVGGTKCYQMEQILPDGQRILSVLDFSDLSEISQVTVNNVNGLKEETTFSKFREVKGVRFPYASVMKSGGEVVHRVEILTTQINVGTMPWMFKRPSGAYLPGKAPEEVEINLDLFKQPAQEVAPSTESFGPKPKKQTAFPDLEESEVESILDDIGKPIL